MKMQNHHRVRSDIMKLMARNFQVSPTTTDDTFHTFTVDLCGPEDTPYESGIWTVRVSIPDNYPFHSPCVAFDTKIVHPNVELTSGTICMDVLNQKWTPLYDLVTVFEVFLPQLLKHPNPHDPLNHLAAITLLREPDRYRKHVRAHAKLHAIDLRSRKNADIDSEVSDLSDDDE